jgi:trans-2,3-dihydro-3-hydroxyanthranilate isomerase
MGFGFSLVDVFSDRPFGGNQLAVFPDAAGIPDETMQQLAREFNFSETTFVLPPRDPSCTSWVRIFTPGRELPFAGHPTLGTAAVLASLSEEEPGEQQFVFEEGIGPVAVAVDGQVIRLHLRSPRYESTGEAPQAAAIAKALTLPGDAIAESWYAGVGLRFCFVRLTDSETVDRAVLDKAAWAARIDGSWSPELGAPARTVLRTGGRRRRGSRHRIGVCVADSQPGPAVTGAGRYLPPPDRPGRGHGAAQCAGGHRPQRGRPDHRGHRQRPRRHRRPRRHDTRLITANAAPLTGRWALDILALLRPGQLVC